MGLTKGRCSGVSLREHTVAFGLMFVFKGVKERSEKCIALCSTEKTSRCFLLGKADSPLFCAQLC